MWNYIGQGSMMFPAQISIGSVDENVRSSLKDGEAPIGDEDYLLVDYSGDFKEYCPLKFIDSSIDIEQWNNRWPFKNILDIVKIVGRTEDGMPIMLGRTLLKDWLSDEWSTLAYFILTTEDSKIDSVNSITSQRSFDYYDRGFFGSIDSVAPSPARFMMKGPASVNNIHEYILDVFKFYDKQNPMSKIESLPAVVTMKKAYEMMIQERMKKPEPIEMLYSIKAMKNYLTGMQDYAPIQ